MVPLQPISKPIVRVFPSRNDWTPVDDFAFVGDPPLYRPQDRALPVYVSVTFKWFRKEGERLQRAWSHFYDNVYLGGPAFGDPGSEFVPGRFLKTGCTITSRGCSKNCGWCDVPSREGEIRELRIKPGWIVQDNNLLACSETHQRNVFEMLRQQNRNIFFNGGLDKHYLRDWHRPLFDSIKIGELWFACDLPTDIPALERAAGILDGIPIRKRRCYVMIGYSEEGIKNAEKRLERVLELGFMPFCQLFQPTESIIQYGQEWKDLRRKWSRPAAYMRRSTEIAITGEKP